FFRGVVGPSLRSFCDETDGPGSFRVLFHFDANSVAVRGRHQGDVSTRIGSSPCYAGGRSVIAPGSRRMTSSNTKETAVPTSPKTDWRPRPGEFVYSHLHGRRVRVREVLADGSCKVEDLRNGLLLSLPVRPDEMTTR